jgi:hypothetical protein
MDDKKGKRQALALVIEQAVSALVNDDEWVYCIIILPREIQGDMGWTHLSSAPFREVGPVIESAIHEELAQLEKTQ